VTIATGHELPVIGVTSMGGRRSAPSRPDVVSRAPDSQDCHCRLKDLGRAIPQGRLARALAGARILAGRVGLAVEGIVMYWAYWAMTCLSGA
jgi:hypothetical protein